MVKELTGCDTSTTGQQPKEIGQQPFPWTKRHAEAQNNWPAGKAIGQQRFPLHP
jgi:hypothetical protein